jgi:hypothetical protein
MIYLGTTYGSSPSSRSSQKQARLPGIKTNGKPASKEEISRLSREYLKIRNDHQRVKMLSAQMTLAQERGQLIEKRLVEQQAAYLLVALRQRILAVPHAYARRILGLKDVTEAIVILRQAMVELLNEIKDLPDKVTNPRWLDELGADDGEPVPSSTGRKRFSKSRR